VSVVADDSDGHVETITLSLNHQRVGASELPPYRWSSEPDTELGELSEGSYDLLAEVSDNLVLSPSIEQWTLMIVV